MRAELCRTRIKVCCIASIDEARLAVCFGAHAIGLVSSMPSGPGPIPDDLIAEIAKTVPPAVGTFLLTCKQDVASIIAQQRHACTNTLQLCDRLVDGTHADLMRALPGISMVQVIHVTGEESIEEAVTVAPHVHGILLDSGRPSLAVKELGGTGRAHDWSISRAICEAVSVPIFLAGGLSSENVRQAIRQVQPFGVDVCSGVRTNGKLDEWKLARFIEGADGQP